MTSSATEPLTDPEPDRRRQHEDLALLDALQDPRPFVALAHVGRHPERDRVVDDPDRFALHSEIAKSPATTSIKACVFETSGTA